MDSSHAAAAATGIPSDGAAAGNANHGAVRRGAVPHAVPHVAAEQHGAWHYPAHVRRSSWYVAYSTCLRLHHLEKPSAAISLHWQ